MMSADLARRLIAPCMSQLTYPWRCPACGQREEVSPGVCPGCGALTEDQAPTPAQADDQAPTLAEAWNREHPGDPMLTPAQRPVRSQPATGFSARTESSERRRRALLVVASPLAGIVLGVAIWNTGVFNSGSGSKPSVAGSTAGRPAIPASPTRGRSTQRATKARSRPVRASSPIGAHREFAGRTFSVAYPAGWTLVSTEAARAWGTDTTIVSPGDPNTLIRVDVTPNPVSRDPGAAAQPIIAAVAGQPGYRELSLTPATLSGLPAEHWEFVVEEAGVLLRKEDDFFTARNGDGIAILTSAPADAYVPLAKRFAALRRTLAVH